MFCACRHSNEKTVLGMKSISCDKWLKELYLFYLWFFRSHNVALQACRVLLATVRKTQNLQVQFLLNTSAFFA